MEVAGSILDEVSFFFSEDRITGGSRGFDSRRAQEKKYFGTVQPVQIGYVHLLFTKIFCAANMFSLCALSF